MSPVMMIIIAGIIFYYLTARKSDEPEKPAWVKTEKDKEWNNWLRTGWWQPKTRYLEFVNAAAIRTSVPAPLIEAVLWVESTDGVNTSGSSGEIGVMQILPSTVPVIKSAWPSLADANPYTIEGNIVLGAAYLRMGYEMHHSWRKAAIGYNAGHASPRVEQNEDEYLAKIEKRLEEILR